MQLIKNGPNVPNELLEAHEEGRMVFFCGAGISCSAGLPDFGGLVREVYEDLQRSELTPKQKKAIRAEPFDRTFSLLEKEYDEEDVRPLVAKALTHKSSAPTNTHKALLTLGRDRKDCSRLVTTNFDRLFEKAIAEGEPQLESFRAPLLPIPNKAWDGLVYLHGQLPCESVKERDPSEDLKKKLILSSDDFGRAYLVERWAARFMSELFRNFTVCFVGYSLSDPILRYMTDAIAARGEQTQGMYAFAGYSGGERAKNECERKWKTKNVTPILYRAGKKHTYLHKTLDSWAKIYRDGIHARKRIVTQYARNSPSTNTPEDDFVGRVLWALRDSSGLPAESFAEHESAPLLEWRELLEEEGLFSSSYEEVTRHLARWLSRHLDDPDLLLWLAGCNDQVRKKLTPEIENRLDTLAKLEAHPDALAEIEDGLNKLAEIRGYLDKLTEIKDRLDKLTKLKDHPDAPTEIKSQQDAMAKLEHNRNALIENPPKGIPEPHMRTLWRLLPAKRVKSESDSSHANSNADYRLIRWIERCSREKLPTAAFRQELREMLNPHVSLYKLSSPWQVTGEELRKPKRAEDLVQCEIRLSENVIHLVDNIRLACAINRCQLNCLLDFSDLLRDALDLMHECACEDAKHASYHYRPSISESSQKGIVYRNDDWTALIDLTREAWLAVAAQSSQQAKLVAEQWWQEPYPLFQRLALFAASQNKVIPPQCALDWLLAEDGQWLWTRGETHRETIRLLVALAPRLSKEMLRKLERAILDPPSAIAETNADQKNRQQYIDRAVWLRLAKIEGTGVVLGADSKKRLERLRAKHPEWQLANDQRDEYPVFRESSKAELLKPTSVPALNFAKLVEDIFAKLVEDIKEDMYTPHPLRPRYDWGKLCRDHFPNAVHVLCALAKESEWPSNLWNKALRVWSHANFCQSSWHLLAPTLVDVPKETLQDIALHIGWWLKPVVGQLEKHKPLPYEKHFFTIARRILELECQKEDVETTRSVDIVMQAINRPVGVVTEALLIWQHKHAPRQNQGLSEDIKDILTELCDTKIKQFRHGRCMLAAHVIHLFSTDPNWTRKYLLPLFAWKAPNDALVAWEGFLCLSARLYLPLLEEEEFKQAFLDTSAQHDTSTQRTQLLGRSSTNHARLLTFAALDYRDSGIFTKKALSEATRKLPDNLLCETVDTLVEVLNSAGDQRASCWENRILPYVKKIWPKELSKQTPAVPKKFSELCIAAKDQFPDALERLHSFLRPLDGFGLFGIVQKFHESGLCTKFPEEALEFLYLIIDEEIQLFNTEYLQDCLKTIRKKKPALEEDARYKKLKNHIDRQSSS